MLLVAMLKTRLEHHFCPFGFVRVSSWLSDANGHAAKEYFSDLSIYYLAPNWLAIKQEIVFNQLALLVVPTQHKTLEGSDWHSITASLPPSRVGGKCWILSTRQSAKWIQYHQEVSSNYRIC